MCSLLTTAFPPGLPACSPRLPPPSTPAAPCCPRPQPAKVKADFAPGVGDRRQELVFIGSGMSEDDIRRRLDACLVTGKPGMDPQAWQKLRDPFPPWRRAGEAA